MWQPVTHCGLTFMRPRRRLWLAGNRPREMDMTNPTGVKNRFNARDIRSADFD
jgi:hypothetical protein